jgi:hypothetical protein
MSDMTPEAALQLIDRVLADVAGTRLDHQRLQQAVIVLAGLIAEPEATETENGTY